MNEWENENEWKKIIESMSERKNKWKNELMNEWMNEWMKVILWRMNTWM